MFFEICRKQTKTEADLFEVEVELQSLCGNPAPPSQMLRMHAAESHSESSRTLLSTPEVLAISYERIYSSIKKNLLNLLLNNKITDGRSMFAMLGSWEVFTSTEHRHTPVHLPRLTVNMEVTYQARITVASWVINQKQEDTIAGESLTSVDALHKLSISQNLGVHWQKVCCVKEPKWCEF